MEDIYSVIKKVLNGNATEEEYIRCTHWVNTNQANREEFEAFRQLFSPSVILDKNTPHFYEGLIRIQTAKQERTKTKVKRRRLAVLICVILSVILVSFLKEDFFTKTNSFQFENVPMQVILAEIEKKFEVEITVHKNTFLHCSFTGTFHNSNINEILTSLSSGSGLTYRMMDEEHYQFNGNGCQ